MDPDGRGVRRTKRDIELDRAVTTADLAVIKVAADRDMDDGEFVAFLARVSQTLLNDLARILTRQARHDDPDIP